MMEDKVQQQQPNVKENKTSVENIKKKTNNDRDKNKIISLIHTIQPMLLVENLFGIFRFQFAGGALLPSNGKLKIIGLIITLFYIVLFCTFVRLPTVINGTSKLVEMVDEAPSVVILIQYITSAIATSFILSKSNINIVKNFLDLDAMLHIDTNEDFYKTSRIKTFRCLVCLTLYHFLVSACDLATDDEIALKKIIELPIYFEEDLEILMFCLVIAMLKSRLMVINDYLDKFLKDKENKTSVFVVREKKTEPKDNINLITQLAVANMKVRDLAATYNMIGETCSLVNQVFNYQIFMTLLSTFTYIVITIWSSLYYYRNNEAVSGAMITIIIWCITAILKVAVMSLSCESLLGTRNNTKILVNKVIMDYNLPKPIRVQAKAFMDLIEAWPLRIFIYDMFSVDITLMLKYISVATTYLIVIIQVSHFA